MPRRLLGVTLALATLLASGCSGGKPTVGGGQATTTAAAAGGGRITLRGARLDGGPWRRDLSLPLGTGGRPIPFYACAVWSRFRPKQPCPPLSGSALPGGTTMRLEQRPIGPAVERADSPGWGLVGTSDQAELRVVLSSFVSGNHPGTVTYRVTLRSASGRVLATSNTFAVTWHR